MLPSCCPDAKDNSFTRSRSSSVTSIDRESREAISAFHFCESYPRKNDSQIGPCVLVGTTQGSVMMVALSLPPGGDQRLQQPVGISSCGKTPKLNFKLRNNGAGLISYTCLQHSDHCPYKLENTSYLQQRFRHHNDTCGLKCLNGSFLYCEESLELRKEALVGRGRGKLCSSLEMSAQWEVVIESLTVYSCYFFKEKEPILP